MADKDVEGLRRRSTWRTGMSRLAASVHIADKDTEKPPQRAIRIETPCSFT